MVNITLLRVFSLLFFILGCVLTQMVYAQDENTVLLYKFDTGSGDVVTDHSGNGNDGQLMGSAEWGDGKLGSGLVLGGNAARDFVEIPDSDSLDLEGGLTVEMWVYLNSASTAGGTGATKESTYKVGPRSDQKVLLRMITSTAGWGAAVVISETTLQLNKWIHTAATYDATSGVGKVYIDGELDAEATIGGDIVPNDDVLWLGRGAGPFLDGKIDEVRISKVARTQKEVQQLMNLGIDGVLSVTPQDKLATAWGKLKKDFAR